ncbi:hypothetical protein [Actinoalloteichus sp. AHMU CJ021]|uniref:hypothetical protein n=1 Tax=Actinoalloteichus sp. AHMU CJ021 TaxID=2072503 RepID=UPI00307BDFC4
MTFARTPAYRRHLATTRTGRARGSIRQRGGSLQVRAFSGVDPVLGKDRYLTRTV